MSDNLVSVPGLVDAVEGTGYGVATAQASIAIQGMSCASCVSKVEQSISDVPGVISVAVNLGTSRASVAFLPGLTTVREISSAIRSAGYSTIEAEEEELVDREEEARRREVRDLQRKLSLSVVLSALVMIGSMDVLTAVAPGWLRNLYVLWLLATPIQFVAGWQFYRGAWAAARHRASDMNTLIAIGTSAAYFYSVSATVFPEFFRRGGIEPRVYFDTAAVIITLILWAV